MKGEWKTADALKGFALAVNMLSILPFLRVHDFFRGINGYAVMFFPMVGLLLGGLLWSVYALFAPYMEAAHLKILLFALWVLFTGAMHLDGFADTIDGLYAPPERAQEVMKDPNVGGMGMIFTATFLIVKASALWHLEAVYLLPLVMMLGRYNVVMAIWFFRYIRKGGIAELAKAEFDRSKMIASSVMVFASALFFGWQGAAALFLFALGLFWLISRWFIKKFGGYSGDMYGFLIEVTELLLLQAILLGVFA